jgi:excisionase family DNA binding protein
MTTTVPDRLLTTGEAAHALSVTPMTLRTWHYKELLKAVRLPGGHFRIPESEIERLKRGVAARVPHE